MIDPWEATHKRFVEKMNKRYKEGPKTLNFKNGQNCLITDIQYIVQNNMVIGERTTDENNEPHWVYTYKKYTAENE